MKAIFREQSGISEGIFPHGLVVIFYTLIPDTGIGSINPVAPNLKKAIFREPPEQSGITEGILPDGLGSAFQVRQGPDR